MTSVPAAGMLLSFPIALAAGSLVLLAAAERAPAADHRPDARVELEVAGVLQMPESPAGILVLREKGARTILPLVIPDGRAFFPGTREAANELLGQAIEALGARVAEVEIERAEETSAGALVRLAQGTKKVELRALPSESVALAVAAGVPIFANRRLLDEEGLTPDDLAQARERLVGEAKRLRL